MSDTTIPIDNKLDTAIQVTTSPLVTQLNQTRSLRWEFLLTFSTFSVYPIFYLICRTHEFNKLGEKKFTPWLWLFSLSPIICWFSLPILSSALNKLERDYKSPHNKKWNFLTIVVMLISNTYLAISTSLQSPIWLDMLVLLVWSASFSLFASRITTLKHALPNVNWRQEGKIKIAFRWLVPVILIPLYIAGTALELIEIYKLKDVHQLEANTTTYISKDQKASLSFIEKGWYQADLGTFSDGSAEAEFGRFDTTNHLMLFTYNEKFELLDAHMHERMIWIGSNLSKATCKQDKYLLHNQLSVKADLICTGFKGEDKAIGIITVIESPDTTYELLGMYSAPNYEFTEHSQAFIQMVREFKAQ